MIVTGTQIATGAGGTGGTGAGVILLNMWMKKHGYAPLEPEEVTAVMTVISPVATVALAILMAFISKFLKWANILVPGVNEPTVPAAQPAADASKP